uniref:Putative extracellular protein TR9_026 n=1 Tax=Trebouxia lynnae TaxID=1825957 RepID=A0A7L9QEP3_9CHLO|nr:putative extracellular protein TR9_026 [Trebouxia lynnae]
MSHELCTISLGALLSCLLLLAAQAQDLEEYVLTNPNGLEAHILPYGAILQKLIVPDYDGVLRDIALGFDHLEPYENGTSPYFGALVGRVANRVANSTFELEGKTYHVSANENSTSLHGGKYGFSRQMWAGRPFTNGSSSGVTLQYFSPDGDEVS